MQRRNFVRRRIKESRDEISLSRDFNIDDHHVRQVYTGGFLIEVRGDECEDKADRLVERMNGIVNSSSVAISRPKEKIMDVKIYGFDVSITKEELIDFVANTGGCTTAELRMNSFRFTKYNVGIAWIKCPLSVAQKLHNIGSCKVGWSKITMEKSRPKPLQCFRCHDLGHSRNNCKNPIDRTGNCYNCRGSGHKIQECESTTCCYVCRQYGKNDNHRVGSRFCTIPSYADRTYYASRRDGSLKNK